MFDKIGRTNTPVFIIFAVQAVNFLFLVHTRAFFYYLSGPLLQVSVTGPVFPYSRPHNRSGFGVKNLGVTTAWFLLWPGGQAEPFMDFIGGLVRDLTGTYLAAYLIAACLCIASMIMVFFVKTPRQVV